MICSRQCHAELLHKVHLDVAAIHGLHVLLVHLATVVALVGEDHLSLGVVWDESAVVGPFTDVKVSVPCKR